MITRSPAQGTSKDSWQTILSQAITDAATLLRILELPPNLAAPQEAFPLRVPWPFVERMEKGNPRDPLLRQVLPVDEEGRRVPGFSLDPLGEREAMAAPGLLHKYQGRVLVTLTGACAIHCRYCFRRHFPYREANPLHHWREVQDYLVRDPSIREVILSGGDPLLLSDAKLACLIKALEGIDHIERLRIHTRLPVVIPQRITERLRRCLTETPLQVIMVLHINHPNELDRHVDEALGQLEGICLLNQSVLLKDVNDDAIVLKMLSERLFKGGILPYYLHLLDRVQGAAHFDVAESEARRLIKALEATLPGYLVPRLVREEKGAQAKTRIIP